MTISLDKWSDDTWRYAASTGRYRDELKKYADERLAILSRLEKLDEYIADRELIVSVVESLVATDPFPVAVLFKAHRGGELLYALYGKPTEKYKMLTRHDANGNMMRSYSMGGATYMLVPYSHDGLVEAGVPVTVNSWRRAMTLTGMWVYNNVLPEDLNA